ncbi:hypothetical protein B0H14DRAFT_3745521 [Mycena olivaceomarginata]|nr:hypothetical protein B0H14DRAFT_3745521 [Mycena olivaceomarginata]
MMIKFSTVFGFAAAAGLAAAAAVNTPRTALFACASAIDGILSSPDPGINCLAPGALNAIVQTGSQNLSVEVVGGQIDHWLTQIAPILEGIANNISAGCGSSFSNTPLPPALSLITTFKNDYPVIREMMCLQNTAANDKFCMTELLTQANLGSFKLAADKPEVLAQLLTASFNLDCNECTKAAWTLAKTIAPSFGTTPVDAVCGANFTATLNTTAKGVTQLAVQKEFSTSKNGVAALAIPTFTGFLLATLMFASLV